MKAPSLRGRIERRILLDVAVDPDVAARQVPPGFTLRLLDGAAVAGICLIRLVELRPPGLPAVVGRTTTAAAHRISVHGPDGSPGVFVPRRDTSSRAAALAGGRVWPGVHGRADITWTADRVEVVAADGARVTVALGASGHHLTDPDAAIALHSAELTAWSPDRRGGLEAADLECVCWRARPVGVAGWSSSWLGDAAVFPPGSTALAGALVMEDVAVTWRAGSGSDASTVRRWTPRTTPSTLPPPPKPSMVARSWSSTSARSTPS